jgi:hypothetical protein
MSADIQNAVVRNTPENGPKRESPVTTVSQQQSVVPVTFARADTHFRESHNRPPRKRRSAERRSREYLTQAEVEQLAKDGGEDQLVRMISELAGLVGEATVWRIRVVDYHERL